MASFLANFMLVGDMLAGRSAELMELFLGYEECEKRN